MSEELKPCPFCESTPKVPEHYKRMGTNFDLFSIGCCDVNIERDTFIQAMDAWNTRPLEDALRAENVRITKVCQDTSSQLWDACRKNNRLEAENERLKRLVTFVPAYKETLEAVDLLRAENAKLKARVEAAEEVIAALENVSSTYYGAIHFMALSDSTYEKVSDSMELLKQARSAWEALK